jgi:hypothetical protein
MLARRASGVYVPSASSVLSMEMNGDKFTWTSGTTADDFTVSFWVYPHTTSNMGFFNNGKFGLSVVCYSGNWRITRGAANVLVTSTAVIAEQWQHVVCTFEDATNGVELYVDNTYLGTDSYSITETTSCNSGTPACNFIDYRVHNYILDSTDVATLYNADYNADVLTSGLDSHFKFAEGTEDASVPTDSEYILDSSGNSRHATMTTTGAYYRAV